MVQNGTRIVGSQYYTGSLFGPTLLGYSSTCSSPHTDGRAGAPSPPEELNRHILVSPCLVAMIASNAFYQVLVATPWPYRRRPEREELVEKSVKKLELLAS